MADVIATVSIYFNLSSEMLSRTSSQIHGRWYLPMFLLRDGLLALINKASFMVLKRFWSSLPNMVKLSIVTSWPEVLWWSYMGEGALRFLDMLITPDHNGRLNTSVYRKVTHTDQYLHWDSHHTISSKYSVVGTLLHRARMVCSTPDGLQKGMKHLHQSLSRCNYPDWAINRVKLRTTSTESKKKSNNNNQAGSSSTIGPKPHIVVPYHQGLSESYKNICKQYGIDVHLKGGQTIKDHLMSPKDKDPINQKSGVIHRFKCDRVDCDDEYIGESARNFEERLKEHLKAPSPIYDHHNTSGHDVTIDNFTILGREDQNLLSTIKEALFIRANNPSLNRNIGKYHLPCIWDEVLLNISELKLK